MLAKRIKQMYEMRYVLIMIKHYQHNYLPYAQLCLLNDINPTPAHGLENSKASNKYHVNFVTAVYPSKWDT